MIEGERVLLLTFGERGGTGSVPISSPPHAVSLKRPFGRYISPSLLRFLS
jgi:hypothetical protein